MNTMSNAQRMEQEDIGVILKLAARPMGITQKELAAALQLSAAGVNYRVNRLVASGTKLHRFYQSARQTATNSSETRWFVSEANRDAYAETKRKTGRCPAGNFPMPRSEITGVDKPAWLDPTPTPRPGSLEALGHPSRRGAFLVYRDGTRVPV